MPAGHLSRRRRVLRRALFVRRNWWWRGAHSRDAGNAAEEDARDVTGSDNAPPRIACTHTHKRGLPRIQDDGDDAIPSACPRALRFPPRPAAFLNRLPRLNALRYQSFPPPIPPVFPNERPSFVYFIVFPSPSFFSRSMRKFSKRGLLTILFRRLSN